MHNFTFQSLLELMIPNGLIPKEPSTASVFVNISAEWGKVYK